MSKTIKQILSQHNNDYSFLEQEYFNITGISLALDPLAPPANTSTGKPLTVTIVIPGWNVKDSILSCLTAIEQSSFNLYYQDRLQIIFVDDGSTDNTWEIIKKSNLSLHLTAIRINHYGQAQALNTAISIAEGDIIISCDADMVLNYYTIEHFVVRHQLLPNVLLVGFRSDTLKNDPKIKPKFIREHGTFYKPSFTEDERIAFPISGWPNNMCLASEHFKRLGKGRGLWMPDDSLEDPWLLPDMVFGALFSLTKQVYLEIGGYNEFFKGWGCSDSYLAAKAVAIGQYIVPVYAASGLHISHPFRTENKQLEYAFNRKLFKKLIRTQKIDNFPIFITKAKDRIKESFSKSPAKKLTDSNIKISMPQQDKSIENDIQYTLSLGEYAKTLLLLASDTRPINDLSRLLQLGDALLGINKYKDAINTFQEASKLTNLSPEPTIQLAIALAADGQFLLAQQTLKNLSETYPNIPSLSYWYNCSAQKHIKQGSKYLNQGFYRVALRCFEAALIIEPNNRMAIKYRDRSLRQI